MTFLLRAPTNAPTKFVAKANFFARAYVHIAALNGLATARIYIFCIFSGAVQGAMETDLRSVPKPSRGVQRAELPDHECTRSTGFDDSFRHRLIPQPRNFRREIGRDNTKAGSPRTVECR